MQSARFDAFDAIHCKLFAYLRFYLCIERMIALNVRIKRRRSPIHVADSTYSIWYASRQIEGANTWNDSLSFCLVFSFTAAPHHGDVGAHHAWDSFYSKKENKNGWNSFIEREKKFQQKMAFPLPCGMACVRWWECLSFLCVFWSLWWKFVHEFHEWVWHFMKILHLTFS